MPQFIYRGRNKDGQLRSGTRSAQSVDQLNSALIKEGIFPIQISIQETKHAFYLQFKDWIQGTRLLQEELSIFARQMKLLHQANVPLLESLKQLSSYTRSYKLKKALQNAMESIEKGNSLSDAMQNQSDVFTPLMINLIRIGENTGDLSGAFANLHRYLEFELTGIKQVKSAFRYPIFALISVFFSILILNIYVIPTFSKFYLNMKVALPWQTILLIKTSNLFIYYGIYLLFGFILLSVLIYRYIHTDKGKYQWHYLKLHIPLVGKLFQRILLIRFCQSLAIILDSGLSIIQGLDLVKSLLYNAYLTSQITQMQEDIGRGNTFIEAISKIPLFSPLELQILAVGEKNGELGPALTYIANFNTQEIEFELKRINEVIGPVLISIVSGIILIIALGVYLPIWDMVNVAKTG